MYKPTPAQDWTQKIKNIALTAKDLKNRKFKTGL